jgi:hypothetical protein
VSITEYIKVLFKSLLSNTKKVTKCNLSVGQAGKNGGKEREDQCSQAAPPTCGWLPRELV